MKALDHLAALLGDDDGPAPRASAPASAAGTRAADAPAAAAAAHQLDSVIGALRQRVDAGTRPDEPQDLQLDAVQRFCAGARIDSLRTARLLCFGLVLPRGPGEPCLMEDGTRLAALLAAIDPWHKEPRRFRRCVQGLIRSYFAYDVHAPSVSKATRRNWETLRDYLQLRLPSIVADPQADPQWVETAMAHRHLFGETPCGPQAEALLREDSPALERLCERLGIAKSSWFLRSLLMARIAMATALDDARFAALIPGLLLQLAGNPALRRRGLALLLERHARSTPQPPRRQDLLEAALAVLGNPWQAGSDVRWGDVAVAARAMVGRWAKAELIERFFSRLGRDPRRAAFWQRYVEAIDNLNVVLGRDAPQAVDERRALRRRAIDALEAQGSTHALVMRIGPLLLVEFSEGNLALRGYETGSPLPFDLALPLATSAKARNSLQSEAASLCLPHRDGSTHWPTWEEMFAATLKKNFGIEPGSATVAARRPHIDLRDSSLGDYERTLDAADVPPPDSDMLASSGQDAHWRTAEAESVPYSRSALAVFSRAHGLRVTDAALPGDALRVQAAAGEVDAGVRRVLAHWGFEPAPGGGWRLPAG